MTWVAVAIGGAAVVGAGASMLASHQQAGAAENAQQIGYNEFQTITGQEAPFMKGGYDAENALLYGLGIGPKGARGNEAGLGYGSLTKPFTTQDWKQLSPMYNFELGQGQQNVLNAESAGQGALSGSALKDITAYNQGLASQSFGNAFNMYQQQNQNIFNRLSGIAQLGQAAATNTGQQGTALAGQQAQAQMAGGAYQAAGTIGAANSLGYMSAIPWLVNQNQNPNNNPGNWDTENPQNFQDWTQSDRRLKSDITRVGALDSGLPVYSFRYGSQGPYFLGVMADEAEKLFPEAVTEDPEGYKVVRYGMLR